MNVQDITVTKGRAQTAVKNAFQQSVSQEINNQLNTAIENERIRTGVITKFYPYLDKAQVQLDNVNKKIICKVLHRYGGDLIDFYTPLESEKSFCDDLKEPCIIPRAQQHVCVLQISDQDSSENLILGYYQNNEIVGFDPAKPGNTKIMSLTEANNFWLEFGRDGLDIRLPSETKSEVGRLKQDMHPVTYAKSDEVYGKDEVYNKTEVYPRTDVYTKSEVDELIEEGGGGAPAPHTHTVADITDIDVYTSTEIKKGYILMKNLIRSW